MLIPGIYDYPRFSPILNKYASPDTEKVIARKNSWKIQPNGNASLNMLGLSLQVPAQTTFLSTGQSKTYNIQGLPLHFQQVSTKDLDFELPESGIIVQVVKALGREHISGFKLAKLAATLPANKWDLLVENTRHCTQWVNEIIGAGARVSRESNG